MSLLGQHVGAYRHTGKDCLKVRCSSNYAFSMSDTAAFNLRSMWLVGSLGRLFLTPFLFLPLRPFCFTVSSDVLSSSLLSLSIKMWH